MKSVIKSIKNNSGKNKLAAKTINKAFHKNEIKGFGKYLLQKESTLKVKGGLFVTDIQGL